MLRWLLEGNGLAREMEIEKDRRMEESPRPIIITTIIITIMIVTIITIISIISPSPPTKSFPTKSP